MEKIRPHFLKKKGVDWRGNKIPKCPFAIFQAFSSFSLSSASSPSSSYTYSSLASHGPSQDPFEMFVHTLSQTPNSQKLFASLLLAKAAEKPEIRRYSLSGGLAPAQGSVIEEQGKDYVVMRPRGSGSVVEFPEDGGELEEWLGTQNWDIGVSAGWK